MNIQVTEKEPAMSANATAASPGIDYYYDGPEIADAILTRCAKRG
jgi:hypothetical protein